MKWAVEVERWTVEGRQTADPCLQLRHPVEHPVARPVDCGGTLGVQGLEPHRAPLPGRLAPMGNVLRLP